MITIFGALGLAESQVATTTVGAVGQSVVYDAMQQVFDVSNEEVAALAAFFVQRSTSDYQIKYMLPGGGRMQRRGRQSLPAEVKGGSSWTVQLPLEDFGASLGTDDVSLAYLTLQEVDTLVESIQIGDRDKQREEIFRAIFNNQSRPFQDEVRGALTIRSLANGDGTLYPPVAGSDDLADANHYLSVGAPRLTFTDANSPIPDLVARLEARFGAVTGGSSIVVLVATAQCDSIKGLADFVPVANRFVDYGDNVSLALESAFPGGLPPGRVIGVCDGAIIVEYNRIPAGYMLAFHLEAPAPLIKRLDTADSKIPAGLHLFSERDDAPLLRASYRNRYGFGVGNRLNGLVLDLTAATANTYTIPAAFR